MSKKTKEEYEQAAEESLFRSTQKAEEAITRGSETMVTLQAQKEQITRMQAVVEETEGILKKSDWVVRGMKSMGGAIQNVFSKKPTGFDKSAISKIQQQKEKESASSVTTNNSIKSKTYGITSVPGPQLGPTGNERISVHKPNNPSLDRQEVQLTNLHDLTKNLHKMANEMTNNLDEQSELLDTLDDKVGKTDQHIKKTTKDVDKLRFSSRWL